jgi:hypothetical protein
LLPDEQEPDLVEILSIGPKPQLYWAAADRHDNE